MNRLPTPKWDDMREHVNAQHEEGKPAFEMGCSPMIQAALEVGGMDAFEKLRKLAEDTVLVVAKDRKLSEQSKVPVPSPGSKQLVRGFPVDLRIGGPDGRVGMCTVTYWNEETQRYRILVELPNEGWITNETPPDGAN